MIEFLIRTSGNILGNNYVNGNTAGQPTIKTRNFAGIQMCDGAAVTVRDGLNGPIVGSFIGVASDSNMVMLPWPVLCANGIYINQATAATNCIVYYG